jgi:hypothetical protein
MRTISCKNISQIYLVRKLTSEVPSVACMSHVHLDQSQQADQRISWRSMPSGDRLSDSEVSDLDAHNGDWQRLSLLSAFSTSSPGDGRDCAPAPSNRSSSSESENVARPSLSPPSLGSRDVAAAPYDNNQGFDEDRSPRPSLQEESRRASTGAVISQYLPRALVSDSQNLGRE